MASIFSVQNLHTFLRRKYFRPPGPPSRPPPGPERGGRRSLDCPSLAGLVSSAMLLLQKSVVGLSSLVVGREKLSSVVGSRSSARTFRFSHADLVGVADDRRPTTGSKQSLPGPPPRVPVLPAPVRPYGASRGSP